MILTPASSVLSKFDEASRKTGRCFSMYFIANLDSPAKTGLWGHNRVWVLNEKEKLRENQIPGKSVCESSENETIFPWETTAYRFLYLLLLCIIPGCTKREAYDCLYSNFSWGYFFNIYTSVTKDNGKVFDKVHTSLYTEESYLRSRKYSNFSGFRILTNLHNQGHHLAKWINRNLGCIIDFFSNRELEK